MFNSKGYWEGSDLNGVPFKVDPIPETTAEAKSTFSMKPAYIVIHNAGSPQASATDTALNNYMKQDDYKIWHFSVDCDSITQGWSIFRSAFHAGDGGKGKGNATGIGIEIADKGSDQEIIKSIENAFNLIYELKKFDSNLIIKPHQFFSGKYCPRWILDHWGWDGFISQYDQYVKSVIEKPADHWAEKTFQSLLSKGIVIHEKRFDDLITRGEVFALLDRVIK